MGFKSIIVSDLHGHFSRYEKLFASILKEVPAFVFFGGDLLPHGLKKTDGYTDFANDFLFHRLRELKARMGSRYPDIFLILGNDDLRREEVKFRQADDEGLLHYLNNEVIEVRGIHVAGYPFIPPTPFRLKDWEKYDTGISIRPGCLHPTDGFRSVMEDYDATRATIAADLEALPAPGDCGKTILLFHSPPYGGALDRANLGMAFDDIRSPDPHIGSKAILDFIREKQPLASFHGHVHESTRETGRWVEKIGKTYAFNAAHDGPELNMILLDDLLHPGVHSRKLL